MKRVLIIGGNGFIGSNLSRWLKERNYEVTSFDIHLPEQKEEGIRYIEGDFFDDENLRNALEGQDVVIHALSTVNPGNSNKRYFQAYSRDFVQSVKLFDLCNERKIKTIFLSSGGTIYGVQEKQPIREEAQTNPINHYGTVKLCIENVIRTLNKQNHSNILIARISNPYGPGQDFNKGVGFVDAAIKKSLHQEPIEIWGDGSVVRDYIYITDVCAMLESLIDYTGSEEVFNLSSGEGTSLNDIVGYLKDMGLNPDVQYKEARSVDVNKVVLDNSKMLSIHNQDMVPIREGIRKYCTYLNENKA